METQTNRAPRLSWACGLEQKNMPTTTSVGTAPAVSNVVRYYGTATILGSPHWAQSQV
jgi:hypothetical protein